MNECQSQNILMLYRKGIYQGWVLVSCKRMIKDIHYYIEKYSTEEEFLKQYCQNCRVV